MHFLKFLGNFTCKNYSGRFNIFFILLASWLVMALYIVMFIKGNDIPNDFLKFFWIFFAMSNDPVNVSSKCFSFVHQLLAPYNTLRFLTATGYILYRFLYCFLSMPQIVLVYGFFFVFNQFVGANVSIMQVNLNGDILEGRFS